MTFSCRVQRKSRDRKKFSILMHKWMQHFDIALLWVQSRPSLVSLIEPDAYIFPIINILVNAIYSLISFMMIIWLWKHTFGQLHNWKLTWCIGSNLSPKRSPPNDSRRRPYEFTRSTVRLANKYNSGLINSKRCKCLFTSSVVHYACSQSTAVIEITS